MQNDDVNEFVQQSTHWEYREGEKKRVCQVRNKNEIIENQKIDSINLSKVTMSKIQNWVLKIVYEIVDKTRFS